MCHRFVKGGWPRSRRGEELLRSPRGGRYWEEGFSSFGPWSLVVAHCLELGGVGGPAGARP